MYLCHVHRYADEDTPCDECESDMPEKSGPCANPVRERTYQDAVTRLKVALDRLTVAQQMFRNGTARD